ncbi:MAG: hypothetical protein HYY00_04965 [Chloroflexi bacterium]|nr:hypothetical protein [Chloroflexota bacterium]
MSVSVSLLRRSVADAVAYLRTLADVREAEVFAANNANLTARLNYSSHIPSNGLEEPKSIESYGVGIRLALQTDAGVRVGFGSEPSDLSLEGVRRAVEKARRGAVLDPEFVSLPRPGTARPRRALADYHDPRIMRIHDGQLVEAGWSVVERALEAFQSSEALLEWARTPEGINDLGLLLTGDVVVLQERVAIGSTSFQPVLHDESTLIFSFVTSMVEAQHAKGSGWSEGSQLADFSGEAGAEAVRNAIRAAGGQRVPDGKYRMVLGPQPVTDMLNNLVLPGLTVDLFYASASPFQGKLDRQVASEMLSIYDHGAVRGLAASKGITDEGLPTGRTDLVRQGRLVGLLSNWYETQRILRDPKGKEKLGADPSQRRRAIEPRNGFRAGPGGGRQFDRPPATTATNVLLEGSREMSQEELLRLVGDGLYIGRIWYTYPINGIAAGDFTCTVVGDSYIIRDGRIVAPLKPNTVRINDSIHNVLKGVLGVGKEKKATTIWSADQVVHAPEIAVEGLEVREIAGYMEGL